MSEKINKIAIGCDHAGYDYKEQIFLIFKERGIEIHDFGTKSDESVDYPDYVHPVAESVANKEVDYGVLICGSGNGVAMTANKHQKVRAALCWNEELGMLARQHNNANVLCLPARFIALDEAIKIIDSFLKTDFEGGRHERRVSKISCS